MKKTLYWSMLLAVVFSPLLSSAQESDTRDRLRIGVKGGMNYSNVYDEKGDEFVADGKFGYVLGGFVSIPFGKWLGFQPEVLLSQKGFSATGKFLGNSYQFTRTTTHLDIPLQIQLKPSRYFSLIAGPQYSYLMKTRDEFKDAGSISVVDEETITNDNIRKNILGFVLGADIHISHLLITGRIGWDVSANNGNGGSSSPRYKNQWLQLGAGFVF
jgi:hypothetical protein